MTLLCVDVVPNCFNCSYVFGIFFRFNLKFFFSLHSALHLFDIFLVSLTFNASYRLNAIDRPSYTSIGDAFHFVSAKYLQRYCQRTQNEIHYVSKNRDTFYKQSNEYFFNKRTPKNTWSAWMCAHVNYNLKSSHANKIIIYIIFFLFFFKRPMWEGFSTKGHPRSAYAYSPGSCFQTHFIQLSTATIMGLFTGWQ